MILQSIKELMRDLSVAEKRDIAGRLQPGFRVFKWLQQLQGLDSVHVTSLDDNIAFTWFIVLEGHEQSVLDWLATHRSTLSRTAQRFDGCNDGRRIKAHG